MKKKKQYDTIEISVKDRAGHFGASDIGACLGVSAYRTPYDVYCSYKGFPEKEKSKEEILRLNAGIEDEEVAAKLACGYWDFNVTKPKKAWFNVDTPFLLCHPDRIKVGKDEYGRKVGIEIKTSSVYDRSWGEPETDQIPYSYLCQCMMYMYCGVCDVVWLIRYCNFGITRYVIERDDKIINAIVRKMTKIKEDFDNDIPPASASIEDVARKYTEPTEEGIEASEEIQTAVREYKELANVKKCTEEAMEALKVQIADSMGNNSYLIDPASGKPLATFKEKTSNRFDSKTFKADNPDMYAKYINTTTSRTFLVK